MDRNKILTYFLVGFSLTILIIGTALIIIGSLALKDSKKCSGNGDNSFSTRLNVPASTVPGTLKYSTPTPGLITTYFIRINMELDSANNFDFNYDTQSQGQEVITKVRNALSFSNEPDTLSVLSIDNNCKSIFINNYNIIIFMTYLNNAPSLDDISNLLSSHNIKVLERKNLINGYTPKDKSCKSFCDINCSQVTATPPTTSTRINFSNNTKVTSNYSSVTSSTQSTNPSTIPSCSTIIAIDSNSMLYSPYYQSELKLVQNFSAVITKFDNILLASYSNETDIVKPFGGMRNVNDFTSSIGSIPQKPGSRLSTLLLTLKSYLKNRRNEVINTVVLVTEKVPNEINKSIPLVRELKEMGSISFIIVGTGAKEEDLQPLNATNVIVYDFATCDENTLNDKFKNFTACPIQPLFNIKSSSSSFYPCKSSIIFSIDASLGLEKDKFEAEVNGLGSGDVITDEWNNFERISLIKYYTSMDIVGNFNSITTREGFFEMVRMIQRSGDGINFANLLAGLESGLMYYPENEVQNHFIFLSNDVTTDDFIKSIPYAMKLKKNGKINLIALGKNPIVGLNYITNTDRILYWDYKAQNANEILKNFIRNKISCS